MRNNAETSEDIILCWWNIKKGVKHLLEKIYALIVNNWSNIRNALLSYVAATVFNALPIGESDPLEQFLDNLDPRNTWYAVIILVVLGLLFFLWILKIILKKIVYACSEHHIVTKEMIDHSSDTLDLVKGYTGYSWGHNKVLYMAPDVFRGWKPEDIVVDHVIGDKFEFSHIYSDLKHKYLEYCESDTYKDIIAKKNNNTRWMLTNIQPNFNKHDKKLYITVRETDWCTTSFVWNFFRNNKTELKKAIKNVYDGHSALYPNSLCMHLVVVTDDDQVVLTRIANTKRNDYPTKWAVTIGEQLEEQDFLAGTNIDDHFIRKWVRRSFEEEFGIEGDEYDRIVDDSSICIMSIDVEADIYNFSFLTIVRLHEKYESFKDYLQKNIVKDKEFVEMRAIPVKSIPKEMAKYKTVEEADSELHPSSLLRMFMCYLHYNGVNKFIADYRSNKR